MLIVHCWPLHSHVIGASGTPAAHVLWHVPSPCSATAAPQPARSRFSWQRLMHYDPKRLRQCHVRRSASNGVPLRTLHAGWLGLTSVGRVMAFQVSSSFVASTSTLSQLRNWYYWCDVAACQTCQRSLGRMATAWEKNAWTVCARRKPLTDSDVRSCSRRQLELAGRQCQAQSRATWVVIQLVGRNKAWSLFAATEAPVRKWSSNLNFNNWSSNLRKKTNLTSLVTRVTKMTILAWMMLINLSFKQDCEHWTVTMGNT